MNSFYVYKIPKGVVKLKFWNELIYSTCKLIINIQ